MRGMCKLHETFQPHTIQMKSNWTSDQIFYRAYRSTKKKCIRLIRSQSRRGSRNQFVPSLFKVCVCVWFFFLTFFVEHWRIGRFSKTAEIKQIKIIIKPMKTNTEYFWLLFWNQIRWIGVHCLENTKLKPDSQTSKKRDMLHFYWLLNISKRNNSTFLSEHHTNHLKMFEVYVDRLFVLYFLMILSKMNRWRSFIWNR